MLTLDIQRDTDEDSPDDKRLRAVATQALALAAATGDREVALRIIDEAEMRALNLRYRGRDYATNVLSFPADLPAGLDLPLLGDIAICAPVVRREAADQSKPPEAHWEHLLVHGMLHLLGFDHEEETAAQTMENLERRILATLGRADPYAMPEAKPLTAEACG